MRYVLYDGNCSFCCNIIERLSSLINSSVILFFSFESPEGIKLITKYNLRNINSVIYIDHQDKIFFKASAVLNICKIMQFPYNLLNIFNIFPNSFLNLVYNFISKNRMFI